MKFIKKFAARSFACFAVGLLAVGCSSSAADEPLAPVDPDDAPVEIVLNGGISLAVDPSAPVQASVPFDTRSIVNAAHDDLQISILRLDATDATPTYPAYNTYSTALNATLCKFVSGSTTDGEKGEINFATAQFYQTNGLKTKLIGWYPQVGATPGSSIASGVVTCDIDGDTDIMLSDEQAGDKNNKITTPLNFSHLLTQIQVSAYAATSDAKNVWGGILDVSVKDENGKQCKITLPGGTGNVVCELPSGSTKSDLPLIKKELAGVNDIKGKDGSSVYGPAVGAGTANPLELGVYESDTKKNAKLLGYAMFAPLVPVSPATSVTLTLKVTTEKGSKDVPITLTGSEGFKEGKAYKLTLKFTATGIVPSGMITDWQTHTWGTNPGDFDGEIEL